MISNLKNSVIAVLATVIFVSAVAAQPSANGKSTIPLRPFKVGETLNYEGKLSKFITSSVADLTLTVAPALEHDNYVIKASARSKGTLLSLFRFSFLYEFSSNVDGNQFRVERTERRTTEKDRLRSGEADFNYSEKRVTYVEVNPKEPMKAPRRIASGIEDQTQDVVSGIYALRLLPLELGKQFDLTVSDSGLVYQVPVNVTGRELQRTIFGKVWCFKVEPDVFGHDRMIEGDGKMVIWITDDARRVPVRSVINTSVGKVDIRLKSATNLK
jgi:hypothetical protein